MNRRFAAIWLSLLLSGGCASSGAWGQAAEHPAAQDENNRVLQDTPRKPPVSKPATLARTFAPSGLLGEHNSAENFAAVQIRTGALRAHQNAADASGVVQGYKDDILGIAAPLKAIVPLDPQSQTLYLKLGAAKGWTMARSGNLTEVDSDVLSGLASLLYRPNPNVLLGLGVTAASTNLEFRHIGGTGKSDTVGIQAEYLHRFSDNLGLAGRAIHDWARNETTIPLGTAGKTMQTKQDARRIYLESALVGNFRGGETAWLAKNVILRPTATVLFQSTSYEEARTSLGTTRPGRVEDYGLIRMALRIERDEKRPFHIVPYVVAGIDQEFVNTVSRVDNDKTGVYLRLGLSTNVAGKGHFDLYYARRDSFGGAYSAGQVTMLLSMAL